MPANRARELLSRAGLNHDGSRKSTWISPTVTYRDGSTSTVDEMTSRNRNNKNQTQSEISGGLNRNIDNARQADYRKGSPSNKYHGYNTAQNPHEWTGNARISDQLQQQQKLVEPEWVNAKQGGGMEGWHVGNSVFSNRDRAMEVARQAQYIPNLNNNVGLEREDREIGGKRYTVPKGTRSDWKPGEGFNQDPWRPQAKEGTLWGEPGHAGQHESGANYTKGGTYVYTNPSTGQQRAMPEGQMRHVLEMYANQGQDISGLYNEIPGRGSKHFDSFEDSELRREWNRRPENISPITDLQYGSGGDYRALMSKFGIDPQTQPQAARQLWHDYHGIGYEGQQDSPFLPKLQEMGMHQGAYNDPTPVAGKYWQDLIRNRAQGMDHLGRPIDQQGYRLDEQGNRLSPEEFWGGDTFGHSEEDIARLRDIHLAHDAPRIGEQLAAFNENYQAPANAFTVQADGRGGPTDGFINQDTSNPQYARALQEEIEAGIRTPDGERVAGTEAMPEATAQSTAQATEQPTTREPQPAPEGVTMPETSGGFSGTTVTVIDPEGNTAEGYIGMDNRTYMADGSRPTTNSVVDFGDGRRYGVVPSGTERADGTEIQGKDGVGGYKLTPEIINSEAKGQPTPTFDKVIDEFINDTGLPPDTTNQELYDWFQDQYPDRDYSDMPGGNSFLQGLGGRIGSGYGSYAAASTSQASEEDESVTQGGGASRPIHETVGGTGTPIQGSLYQV